MTPFEDIKNRALRLYYLFVFHFPLGTFRTAFKTRMPLKPPETDQSETNKIFERSFYHRVLIALIFLLVQSIGTAIAFTWSISIPFLVDDLLLGWLIPNLPTPLRDLAEMIHEQLNSILSPFQGIWKPINEIAKVLSGLSPISVLPIALAFFYTMWGSEKEVELTKEYYKDWDGLSGENQMGFLREIFSNHGLSTELFTPTMILFAYLISVIFFLRRTRKIIFEINRDAPLTNTHRAVEKKIQRFFVNNTIEFQHNQKDLPRVVRWLLIWSFIPGLLIPILFAIILLLF
ncbi:MAG: hypothetical protein ACFFAE_20955 [Candidatus Hodarchaeota archaeon]